MKNHFKLNRKLPFKRWLLPLIAFLGIMSSSTVQAQSTANYAFTTSTTGSLALDANGNTINMSSGTTQVLASNTSQDQSMNAAAIPFPGGFSFSFGGNSFTSYFATSNGIVQLGATAVISGSTYTAAGGTLAAPRFSAFDGDLGTGTSGGVFGKLVGTAPNRCYVIEFRNMTQMWTSAYTNDGTYQVRFYETTGVVEYVYGTMYCTSITNASDASPEVGFSWGTAANQSLSINISTAATNFSGTMIQNTVSAGANIANLSSAADGSRRVYSFTPPSAPSAPTALSFTNVTATGMTLNWVDNATNEYGYIVYRSLDDITYVSAGQAAANNTAFVVTGLNPFTAYFWKVYALAEGGQSTPALTGTQATSATTLSGVKTVGAGGDYQNLTTAFADINTQGLAGNLDLQLIAGYPAAPETYPILSSGAAAVGAFQTKVYPTVAGLAITSANTTGTLSLNNGTNIIFDGRVNQTGPADLVIANTNAGASYAVQFINDARNNTLSYCIIQSANTSVSSGTIVIGTTNGTNGNDNNAIHACDIRDAAATPSNAIYAVGTTTTAAQFNNNITISDNNIFNYFNAGSASIGVYAGSGNSTWTITNNKLFQTAARTYTLANTHNGIQVSSSGDGFVITGNTIGSASSTGTGVYSMTSTVAIRFIGINVSAGTATASSVQGNTITAFNLTTSSGAATGNGIFAGINVTSGNVNIGNITANTIGSMTGTGAITATSSASGGMIVGINSSSAGVINISNNLIGSLTVNGSTATVSGSITGIQVSAGTPTINGNTIGSTTTANSINSPTVATSGIQLIRGIDVTSGVSTASSIQSNTIANMNQSGTTTGSNIRGITYTGTGLAAISLNTVYNLSGANAFAAFSGAATGVQGILHSGIATTGAAINKNTIYALSATNTGAVQTNVNGIGYSNPTAGSVTGNTIYDLRNASTMTVATTPPTGSGILVRAAITSALISNNMISLGDAQTTNTQYIGIWNNFSASGTINIFHNSVSISGVASAGALPSFGLLRGDNSGTAVTTPVSIRNNIFSNSRSGGTGKHYAIANQGTAPSTTGWGNNASNYNVLNTVNSATVGLWGSTDGTFNAWRAASLSDLNSYSAIPVTFVNAATADLHLNMGATPTPLESNGVSIAAVTTDYDSQVRPGPSGSVNGGGTFPDLGADEFDGAPALPVITLNSVTPAASTQCTSVARLVSVNATTPAGTIASVNLTYTVNGTSQAPIAMTNTSGAIWTATIPSPAPANATIAWAVVATSSTGISSSYTGTSYADEPLLAYTASAVSDQSAVCTGSSVVLTAYMDNPGVLITHPAAAIANPAADEDLRTVRISQGATVLLNNSSAPGSLTGTIGTATGTAGSYSNFTAFGPTALSGGQTYNLFVASIDAPSYYTNYATAFIDFNRDGDFADAGESLIPSTGLLLNAATDNGNDSITVSFTVPASAINGLTRMRVAVTETGQTNAAGSANIGYGEFEDYAILISGATSGTGTTTNITSVTWMDGATTVSTENPFTANTTVNTTYTAQITAFGCLYSPSPTVSVNVNPLPSAPTAANSTQCGVQVPSASVTSTTGVPAPIFKWYAAATGGTALQTGASNTFTSTISVTTTLYVSELSALGCESVRTPVTINVSIPDAVSLTASQAAICIGESVTLTAANTNATPVQFYTYSTVSTTGSGNESAVAGASLTVTPTASGSYTYALSAVAGGCTAAATATVQVNALPVISGVGASPLTVCSGDSIALTAGVLPLNGGTAFLGTQTVAEFNGSVYRNGAGTGDFRHQLLYTAAEMTAAGFTAGNISSLAFTVTSAGSGIANNYTIKLANSPATALGATFQTGAFTTVYNAATYTAVNGLNVHTFSIPFAWDGTSNIVVDICYTTPATGSSSTVAATTPAALSNASLLVSAGACSAAAGGVTYANRPLIRFSMNINSSYTWSWAPGTGLNTASVSTAVMNNTGNPVSQAYTVTAMDNATGCVNTATTATSTITVNPLPVVNAGSDVAVCPGSFVTLTGTGNATAYTWNNGVSQGAPFTPAATTTYTVTADNGICTATDQVTVTVNALPAATAALSNDITLTASAGTAYQWNDCGTGLPVTGAASQTFTATANGSYSVTVIDAGGCSATSTCVNVTNMDIKEITDATISVFPNPTTGSVTITMSSGNAAVEIADATGKTLRVIAMSSGDKVDLSAYETGVYFLRIKTDAGSAIERVVKN